MFWMVKGRGPTSCHHDTKESAEREAERLARANPGEKFTVLAAIGQVVKDDVKWTGMGATMCCCNDCTNGRQCQVPF